MKSVRAKWVLITGSASGIGRKLAVRLAREGAKLVLTDVKSAELQDAGEEVARTGATVRTYVVDVTDTEAVVRLREQISREIGAIDVLVNNAGVVFGGPFLEVPWQRHALTYQVNVVGLVAMTHAFLPDLLTRGEAHLVNVASASGLIGLPNGATYASSKWAVIGFSESIRRELEATKGANVKVTTICPSYIATGMFSGVRTPLLTPMLSPDKLVDKIYQAIVRDELFLFEPLMVKTLPLLRGLLPHRWFDRITDAVGVSSSMRTWTGHAPRAH